MLLVGAACRGAGKTSFLEAILRRMTGVRPVMAAKVTVIRTVEGGIGSGECGSLGPLPYLLLEDQGEAPDKDTGRLLTAGASRVFWLRVAEAHLQEARDRLLEQLEPGVPCVCESDSLRQAVEPDAFVALRRTGETEFDESFLSVRALADREVVFHGDGWDLDPALIGLDAAGWTVPRDACAIVLAGGSSTRMGRDKALIPIEGTSLIERAVARLAPRFSEVILSTRSSADYPLPGCRVVPDRMTGLGPLHGLACALEASRHELNLVVPCDLPEVPVDFAGRLLRACGEADVAVPCHPDGRLEPLFAVYRRGVLPAIQAALSSGERRVVSFFDRVRVQHVELPAGVTLANLNSPADLEAFSSRPRPQPL